MESLSDLFKIVQIDIKIMYLELARKEVTEGFCFIYCCLCLRNIKKMNNGEEFL